MNENTFTPRETAILVVDATRLHMQFNPISLFSMSFVLRGSPMSFRAAARMRKFTEAYRQEGALICHCRPKLPEPWSRLAAFHALTPQTGDWIVEGQDPRVNSVFRRGTHLQVVGDNNEPSEPEDVGLQLQNRLKAADRKNVIVIGYNASQCVPSTARDSTSFFNTAVAKDCTGIDITERKLLLTQFLLGWRSGILAARAAMKKVGVNITTSRALMKAHIQ